MSKIRVQTSMGEMKEATVIGASHIGAILGFDKYTDIYGLWLKLTGRAIRETNQFAQRGIGMEKYIGDWYASEFLPEGRTLVRDVPFKKHPEHDWLGCYTDGDLYQDGVYIGSVNFKSIASDFGAMNSNDPVDWVMDKKPTWYWGAQAEMAIDGSSCHRLIPWVAPTVEYDDFQKIAVDKRLFDNQEFFKAFFTAFPILDEISIERNDKDIGVLIAAAQAFWNNHILTDKPPVIKETEVPHVAEVADSTVELEDEKLVEAFQWIHNTRKSLDEVEAKVWPRLDQIDAKKIMAGDLPISKIANKPRVSLSTDRLLAELPKKAILKVLVELYQMGVLPEGYLTGPRILGLYQSCSKGLDYSNCYVIDNISKPYQYRFGKK